VTTEAVQLPEAKEAAAQLSKPAEEAKPSTVVEASPQPQAEPAATETAPAPKPPYIYIDTERTKDSNYVPELRVWPGSLVFLLPLSSTTGVRACVRACMRVRGESRTRLLMTCCRQTVPPGCDLGR
jgi:hypothetical protein